MAVSCNSIKVGKFWSTALVRKKKSDWSYKFASTEGWFMKQSFSKFTMPFLFIVSSEGCYQLSVSLACWQSTKVFSKTDKLIHSYYLKPLSFKGELADILIKTLIRSCWLIMTLLLMNALHWTIFWKATPISVRRTLNSSYRLLVC